ncbi:MAG: glycerol kinase GlpK [Acidimicrobiia bacterium]
MYVAAIDQGTTSTRCIVYADDGTVLGTGQQEHRQIFPRPGWVEHDPAEIMERTRQVIAEALDRSGVPASRLAGVGITNQRETVVAWDRETGRPIGNAIVWQDTRTDALCRELGGEVGADRFKTETGLPLATYFSGPKVRWLLDHDEVVARKAAAGTLAVGTIDSWLVWNLTGGPDGGVHITDVTNASRTMLMDIRSHAWSPDLCEAIGVPIEALPEIRSSSEVYGEGVGVLAGAPIAGILGDQQAALFGQACTEVGEAKNTYGTGCFMLLNTGTEPIPSEAGLLTTVAYQLGESAPVYALEGSIAVAGSLIQWLRDNLGLIDSAPEVEDLAGEVDDNGGVFVVPAFSGLFAPWWRDDARGVIAGLTGYATKAHIARASLEAVAYQAVDVAEAMASDSGVELTSLKVDGGMVRNELLMQFQADVLGVPVVRPKITETTALGAAYAAGLGTGVWASTDEIRARWAEDTVWEPSMAPEERDRLVAQWHKAVEATFGWVE